MEDSLGRASDLPQIATPSGGVSVFADDRFDRLLPGASVKQRRTTTETILRAFSKYTLNLQRSRYGRIVYPTRLSARQRELLVQLGFPTPAQILYRRLARPPPD